MNHPKMAYTYVGIDSHKATHTAVFLDCFFGKLGEVSFANMPSGFPAFLKEANKLKMDGTEFLFGLEDISVYGRTLMVFLTDNGQKVKHVNALLVARERKNQTITQKTDSVDAECAARVLLSKFDELPDTTPNNKYWLLRSLVVRRDFVVKTNSSLKNHLHSILTPHYPNYSEFFPNIDSDASLAFFMRYPSPSTLECTALEELAEFLREASNNHVGNGKSGRNRAKEILDTLQNTTVPFQEIRDETVRSTIRQIQANSQEIERLETSIVAFLKEFDCTLTSMNGIDAVCAAQLLSCIGDITKFSTPAKLARYSGIAPVTYASGKKDLQFANQRGNRELNSIFHQLALRLISTNHGRARNPFFYEYYHRKISEGKTKRQALKCVARRLVNIVWTMLANNEEYVNPPMLDVPKKEDGKEK
jgi:transposase